MANNAGDAPSIVPNENSGARLGKRAFSKRLDHFNVQVGEYQSKSKNNLVPDSGLSAEKPKQA